MIHDLRQPLAALGALVAAAESAGVLPAESQQYLRQMKTEVAEMTELCHRFLEETAPPTLCWLDDVARQAVATAERASGRSIELRPQRSAIIGDAPALRRAVRNLLENACRAAGRHGRVRVTVERRPRAACLRVEDGGAGFSRVPPGATSLGLGLGIVRATVAAHHGHVEIGVSELGGAALTLVLPPLLHSSEPVPSEAISGSGTPSFHR